MKVLLLALLAALIIIPAAQAGHKGFPVGNGNNDNNPTVVISPAAPVAGDSVSFSGCGYKAGTHFIYIYAAPVDNLGVPVLHEWVSADSNGCFASSAYVASSGDYTVSVNQDATNRHAALDFTVG